MKTPTEVSAFLKSFALKNQSEVVRLAGIEPTTLGFGGQYSIH